MKPGFFCKTGFLRPSQQAPAETRYLGRFRMSRQPRRGNCSGSRCRCVGSPYCLTISVSARELMSKSTWIWICCCLALFVSGCSGTNTPPTPSQGQEHNLTQVGELCRYYQFAKSKPPTKLDDFSTVKTQGM